MSALTPPSKETVIQRVQGDPTFAQALLSQAATLFLNGEPETARLILRDLVNATIGFEQLATLTEKPSKSLHRMLSPTGTAEGRDHPRPGLRHGRLFDLGLQTHPAQQHRRQAQAARAGRGVELAVA